MATTAQQIKSYLDGLPEERKRALSKVRSAVKKALPKGYRESFDGQTITYEVPLSTQPDTYNGKPLQYAALANRKGNMVLYLMGLYVDPKLAKRFEKAYRASGKKYDVGKSCVRFKTLDDLDLDAVADVVAAQDVNAFVAKMTKPADKKKTPKKAAPKKPAKKPIEDRVILENVNVPSSRRPADGKMYRAMKKALMKIVPRKAPGITQREMVDGVVEHLPEGLFPGGAKAGWWVKAVHLDLEAKGEMVRDPTKPLTWRRVRPS